MSPVFWPGSGDQPATSISLTHEFKVGVELLQIRNGFSIGRRTALGVLVEGTEQSMRKEFQDVFDGMMRGELGKRLRGNVEKLAEEMKADTSDSGESTKDLRRLAEA